MSGYRQQQQHHRGYGRPAWQSRDRDVRPRQRAGYQDRGAVGADGIQDLRYMLMQSRGIESCREQGYYENSYEDTFRHPSTSRCYQPIKHENTDYEYTRRNSSGYNYMQHQNSINEYEEHESSGYDHNQNTDYDYEDRENGDIQYVGNYYKAAAAAERYHKNKRKQSINSYGGKRRILDIDLRSEYGVPSRSVSRERSSTPNHSSNYNTEQNVPFSRSQRYSSSSVYSSASVNRCEETESTVKSGSDRQSVREDREAVIESSDQNQRSDIVEQADGIQGEEMINNNNDPHTKTNTLEESSVFEEPTNFSSRENSDDMSQINESNSLNINNNNRPLVNINMSPRVLLIPINSSNMPSNSGIQKKIGVGNKRKSSETSNSSKLRKLEKENNKQINNITNSSNENSIISTEKIQKDPIRQLKSVLIVLHRYLQNNFKAYLLTDVKEPKYLSDAVFCFQKRNETSRKTDCILYQVRHMLSNESRLPSINYRSLSSPDFNIGQYYSSYLEWMRSSSFQQENKIIRNIIIYSNLELNVIAFQNNNIKVVNVGENQYKLEVDEHSKLFKTLLNKTSDLPALAKSIVDFINDTEKQAGLPGPMKKYHMALIAEHVVKTTVIKEGNKKHFFGKFHENFIKEQSISEAARELRGYIVNYLNHPIDANMKFRVIRNFGKEFVFYRYPEVNNIDKVATELVTNISSSLKIPTERILIRRYDWMKDDLNKITVHILEKRNNDTVVFTKNFLDSNVDLPGNLNVLRNTIKRKLVEKQINFSDLSACKFKISNFCDKELDGLAKKLPRDDCRKIVSDFFRKLVFVVNKEDVDSSVVKVIGQELALIRDEACAINLQNDLLKWFQLNNSDIDPFALLKTKVSKTIIKNQSENRCGFPETMIEFKPDILNEIRNHLISKTNNFIIIKTTNVPMSILKLGQVTKSIPEYSDSDKCMLINSEILRKMSDHIIKTFESPCTNLLAIEWDKNRMKIENIPKISCRLRRIAESHGGVKKLLLIIYQADCSGEFDENFTVVTDKCRMSDVTKDSQNKLLEKVVVNVHDRSLKLKDLININMLPKLIRTSRVLMQILNDDIAIGEQFNAPMDLDEDCYIPGCIKQHVVINKDVFAEKIDDIFVISGIEKTELRKFLPSGKRIYYSHELDSDMRTELRFILLTNTESELGFNNIAQKNQTRNVHLLRYESRVFVWQKSSGSIGALFQYKIRESHYVQDSMPGQDKLPDGTAGPQTVIISGESGTGKSVYLYNLAKLLLSRSESEFPFWIIAVKLSNTILQGHECQIFKDTDDAVTFLMILLGYKLDLFRKFFTMSAKGEMKLRPILIFDGFGELRTEYTSVVINLIKQLQGTHITRIYVTARPSSATELEVELNTFSHTLSPFTHKERVNFLVKYWVKSGEQYAEQALHEQAEKLLQTYGSDGRTVDLTSSPQQLKMLAEIYRRYLDKTSYEYTTVHLQDQHDLYKRFIEIQDSTCNLATLQTMSLQTLLTPVELHWLGFPENLNGDNHEFPAIFSHSSFAEYFTANYLWQNRSSNVHDAILRCCDGLVEGTSPVFLSSLIALFRLSNHGGLVHFVSTLARQGHVRFLRALLKSDLPEYRPDEWTVLHDAAKAGQLKVVQFLLERFNDVKFVNRVANGKSAIQLSANTEVACELALMNADVSGMDKMRLEDMALHVAKKTLQGNRLQRVAEKLLMLAPKAAARLSREDEYPKLLAYFFTHNRVEVIERLLEVIDNDTDRYKILESGDFLDHVNKSSSLRDEERLKVTRFLIDKIGWSLGKKDKFYLWSVLKAAAKHEHVRTFEFFIDQYPRQHAGFLEYCLLTNKLEIIEFLLRNRKCTVDPKTGDTTLHTAVRLGASPRVIRLLVDKDGVNNVNNNGENPLCMAIKTGQDLSLIEYLMDKSANPNAEDNSGLLPWCYAILEEKSKYTMQQQLEIIKYFLNKMNGKMPKLLAHEKNYSYTKSRLEIERKLEFFENIDNYDLDFAKNELRLHKAIKTSELSWCRFLIANGADVNIKDIEFSRTTLHIACEFGHYDVAKYLLQNGAIFDQPDKNGRTPLQLVEDEDEDMASLLRRASELFSGKKLSSLLKDELSVDRSKLCKSQLRYLLGCRDRRGRTLLHAAVDTNSRIKSLMKVAVECSKKYPNYRQPDVNACDFARNTPMHLAANKGYKNIVAELVEEGAYYDVENAVGKTPRKLAEENNHENTVELLDAIETLFSAVQEGNVDEVQTCLSQNNRLVNARNRFGQTPLHLACKFKDPAIAKYIIHVLNGKVYETDCSLKTPLHYAAESDSEECAKVLLKAGALIDARDRDGQRPLDLDNPQRNRTVRLLLDVHDLFADILSDEPRIFATENRLIEHLRKHDIESHVVLGARDREKNLLLHHAARLHYLNATRLLLRYGAAYNARNAQSKTPIDLAQGKVKQLINSVARLFRQLDVKNWIESELDQETIAHCRESIGYTLMHKAAKEGKTQEVEWLVRIGADLKALSNKGKTVANCADKTLKKRIAELIAECEY